MEYIKGIIIVLTLSGFYSCVSMCNNEITNEKLSPSGKFKAVLFSRDCGATTPYSLQVSIIKSNKELKNEKGNIFIGSHATDVSMSWTSNEELLITHNCTANHIYKIETLWKGISVKYITQ